MSYTGSFGSWLKQRRKEMGLTQEQLAQTVGCAAITIRKIEACQRQPSRQIAERLCNPLEITPDQKSAFLQFALTPPIASKLVAATAGENPNNLFVSLTPLSGREQEIATIQQKLLQNEVRLLTLLGPAGAGKTRLGLEVARRILSEFNDGVFFVALAAVREPRAVIEAISQTLDLHEGGSKAAIDELKDYLKTKRMLLLLDNFEQVIAAGPDLAEILQFCSQLKILVTSRASLHISGEHEFVVPTLALPPLTDLATSTARTIAQYPSVQLFVLRCQAVKPEFELTDENAQAVVEICNRLDGLPLALELAAVHSKFLAPTALLSHLEKRLDLLNKGAQDLPLRHQTLRNALDWSYNLLDEPEKTLFRGLGVFAGSCEQTAVQEICYPQVGHTCHSLAGLESLVNKSLLIQQNNNKDGLCFGMLEVIREYAEEQLYNHPEEFERLSQYYTQYYLSLVKVAEQQLKGAEQVSWLERLEQAHSNLPKVLKILLESGQTEIALSFSGALWQFWFIRGYLNEGRQWLKNVLALPEVDQITSGRAQALTAAGFLAWVAADYKTAQTYSSQAALIWQELPNQYGLGQALLIQGLAALGVDEVALACTYFTQSLTLFRHVGDSWAIARALNYSGYALGVQRNFVMAQTYLEESAELFRAVGDRDTLAATLNNLGCVLLEQGHHAKARRVLEESLALFLAVGNSRQKAWTLNSLGEVYRYQAHYDQAENCYIQSLEIFRQIDQKNRVAQVLHNLGHIALHRQNYAASWHFFSESLTLRQKELSESNSVTLGLIECLAGLAGTLAYTGQPCQAAQLLGAVAKLSTQNNLYLERTDLAEYKHNLRFTRRQLGKIIWHRQWQEGQELNPKQGLGLVSAFKFD